MTDSSNEHISNISHITESESFPVNTASTITSGISLSNDNQSNPTTYTSTSTSTISVVPVQSNHSQIIKYNLSSTLQNLLGEAQLIY